MSFGRFWLGLPVVFLLISMSQVQAEPFKFVSINLASKHVGATQSFNEDNFGLGLGYAFDLNGDWRGTVEAGFYKNSYSMQSTYAIGSVEYPLFKFKKGSRIHIGAFAGLADYGEMAKGVQSKGFGAIGDFVLIGGVQASYATRYGTEFVFGAIPAAPNADALLTFRIRQRF